MAPDPCSQTSPRHGHRPESWPAAPHATVGQRGAACLGPLSDTVLHLETRVDIVRPAMPSLVSPPPPGQPAPTEQDCVAGDQAANEQTGTWPGPRHADTFPLGTSGFDLRPRTQVTPCSAGGTPCHPHRMRTRGRLEPPGLPQALPPLHTGPAPVTRGTRVVRAGWQLTPQTSAPLRPLPQVSRVSVTKGHSPPGLGNAGSAGSRLLRRRRCRGSGGEGTDRAELAARLAVWGPRHTDARPQPDTRDGNQSLPPT